jgi:hypothetical protein
MRYCACVLVSLLMFSTTASADLLLLSKTSSAKQEQKIRQRTYISCYSDRQVYLNHYMYCQKFNLNISSSFSDYGSKYGISMGYDW